MKKFLSIFKKDKKGQALVEYALILVLIAVVVLLVLTGVGTQTNKTISKINSAMSSANG